MSVRRPTPSASALGPGLEMSGARGGTGGGGRGGGEDEEEGRALLQMPRPPGGPAGDEGWRREGEEEGERESSPWSDVGRVVLCLVLFSLIDGNAVPVMAYMPLLAAPPLLAVWLVPRSVTAWARARAVLLGAAASAVTAAVGFAVFMEDLLRGEDPLTGDERDEDAAWLPSHYTVFGLSLLELHLLWFVLALAAAVRVPMAPRERLVFRAALAPHALFFAFALLVALAHAFGLGGDDDDAEA